MKLLIVTSVVEFHNRVLELFKEAGIDNFSESEIGGHKQVPHVLSAASWFPGEKGGSESTLFFSFTYDKNIDLVFRLITEFNRHMETHNPIKAVVVPIERHLYNP